MSAFFKIAFTDAVRALQERNGSRTSYARIERSEADASLGSEEVDFIESRDSFYIATVNSDGWPYIQHRGGQRGFLRAIDSTHLAFADFGGNRQYLTVGNLQTNDRVALFLMDYPTRTRLKILAHAGVISCDSDPELAMALSPEEYRAKVERIFLLQVVGYNWNCAQHITPRYTLEDFELMTPSSNTEDREIALEP
jgi:uncharacterized protein